MISMAHLQPRKPGRRKGVIPPLSAREIDALFTRYPPQPRHHEAAAALRALDVVTDDAVRPILLAAIGGAS